MKGRRFAWIAGLVLLLVLAACGGESGTAVEEPAGAASDAETEMVAGDESMDDASDEEMAEAEDENMSDAPETEMDAMDDENIAGADHDEGSDGDMAGTDEGMAAEDDAAAASAAPPWFTHTLTDAASGETFTLADFAGKTVFVEPMATWCTNCRRQLTDVKFAQANLDPEEVVIIGLSVETNLSDQELAQFASQADFNWTWAVATPELLRDLVATFGQSVTNAPATPHFIIRPDGTFADLETGFESPEELIAQIEAAQQG